jgi:DNA ligase-1
MVLGQYDLYHIITQMEWPTLYTLTGTQNIRYWKISVIVEDNVVYICREYGKHCGKPIINKKLMSEAKSKPTVYDQSIFEAEKDWKEMIDKKGYVSDINVLTNTSSQLTATQSSSDASLQVSDTQSHKKIKIAIKPQSVVEGTGRIRISTINKDANQTRMVRVTDDTSSFKFLPMLANKWIERKKYVKYPCITQPKLDGVRYTARKLSPTVVVIKTRNDAECPFFDEIKNAIRSLNLAPNVLLDGEFYSKRLQFRTLNGYCNRKKLDGKTGYNTIPKDDLDSIQYNIFDCYFIDEPAKPFNERYQYLSELLSKNTNEFLQLVPIVTIKEESEIQKLHDQFVVEGYEGIMIRNISSPYKLKDRSNDLLKYKNFQDAEFEIVSARAPTNGKEEGCIIWELKLPTSDDTFTCRPRDTYDSRKTDWIAYQSDPSQFIGLMYTVRFQETYENGVPRFPSGIAIRYDS